MSHPSANYLSKHDLVFLCNLPIDWWIDDSMLMCTFWMACNLIRFSTIRDTSTQCSSRAEWHEECRWHNGAFFSSFPHLFCIFDIFLHSFISFFRSVVCDGNEAVRMTKRLSLNHPPSFSTSSSHSTKYHQSIVGYTTTTTTTVLSETGKWE
jgi:hypothetical protein